jgi:acyl-CoA synthetase (AMP-forming)/AMP-acid ligase II
VARAAARWPQRTALVCDDERVTYRELDRWVNAMAADLVRLGLQQRDRLLWQLPNSLDAMVLHLACWRIGVVSVPVVPAYRQHELAQIFADARPSAVAFSAQVGTRTPAADIDDMLRDMPGAPATRLILGGELAGWTPLPRRTDVGAPAGDVTLPDPLPPHEPCLLLYTSGTTARPKGALHSSETLLAEATTLRDTLGFSYRDVFITGAPVTHIAGLLIGAIAPASCGAIAVLMSSWDPDAAVSIADREHATFSCGPTVFLQGYVERYEEDTRNLHRLSVFMCGGSAVPPSLIERADAVGIRAFRSWGMTEVPTIGLVGPDDSVELRATRDGQLSEGCEATAVDAERRALPPGSLGELRVRGPEQMLGYTDPELNATQVDAEGWFYTGDVGTVDEQGWVTMTGRLKDVINRGGEKFSSQDIENAIASHPDVSSVAVTGLPEPHLGECVAAFVVLRPGRAWPGTSALIGHLEAQRLARPKFPVVWRAVPELPMTLTGKIQKNRLIDLWETRLSAEPDPA